MEGVIPPCCVCAPPLDVVALGVLCCDCVLVPACAAGGVSDCCATRGTAASESEMIQINSARDLPSKLINHISLLQKLIGACLDSFFFFSLLSVIGEYAEILSEVHKRCK